MIFNVNIGDVSEIFETEREQIIENVAEIKIESLEEKINIKDELEIKRKPL